jgi:hypothetical protein
MPENNICVLQQTQDMYKYHIQITGTSCVQTYDTRLTIVV